MVRVVGRNLARDQIVDVLSSGPKRYSELVKLTERPDKTIFVSLGQLQAEDLVRKRSDGLYELTEKGRPQVEQIRAQQNVWEEGSIMGTFSLEKKPKDVQKLRSDMSDIMSVLTNLRFQSRNVYEYMAEKNPSWKDSIPASRLIRIINDIESFLIQLAGILDLGDLPALRTLVRMNNASNNQGVSYSKESVLSELTFEADKLRKTCEKAKEDFKGHQHLTQAFDLILGKIQDFKETLKI